MQRTLMGRYIVTDPEICQGKPTFRGIRILAADVLEQVADGLTFGGQCEARGSRNLFNQDRSPRALHYTRF